MFGKFSNLSRIDKRNLKSARTHLYQALRQITMVHNNHEPFDMLSEELDDLEHIIVRIEAALGVYEMNKILTKRKEGKEQNDEDVPHRP